MFSVEPVFSQHLEEALRWGWGRVDGNEKWLLEP